VNKSDILTMLTTHSLKYIIFALTILKLSVILTVHSPVHIKRLPTKYMMLLVLKQTRLTTTFKQHSL